MILGDRDVGVLNNGEILNNIRNTDKQATFSKMGNFFKRRFTQRTMTT